ncbi:MAG: 3-hydroxyacyl-[acyl-carrier-protein] dehydratase FabZ [Firmicutes bacterium ML8_F2]|jgi:3-hydroxyacyl-[acyl-carrier-protein] dehydratase|nr:MAG: 3-hydroxyacyl-[acyl-carrier-protein] dehydratase FabZ [Firmicutes bacterium ML8_F2]
MLLNSNEIQKIIPHRYPFLMVDRIIEIEPGLSALGEKAVSANEMHFMGHFPEEHVMPGVLIIEALAQTGAVAILSLAENRGKIAYFAGIKKARFRHKVIPGDVLRLAVEINGSRGPLGMGSARAYVGDKLVCEAELSFALESES